MEEYEKNIVPHIEAIYETFTSLEKNIADFFIRREGKGDLSASLQKSAVTKDTVNFYSAMNKREHQ